MRLRAAAQGLPQAAVESFCHSLQRRRALAAVILTFRPTTDAGRLMAAQVAAAMLADGMRRFEDPAPG